jgi:hypothetical protein
LLSFGSTLVGLWISASGIWYNEALVLIAGIVWSALGATLFYGSMKRLSKLYVPYLYVNVSYLKKKER